MYLGRLEYEKGIHDVIAALPRIRRTHPGTTLTIAGDWHPTGLARRAGAKTQGAQGHRRSSAIWTTRSSCSLLHTADAAVLPSHYEPFGIVALEAAATGIPLVTVQRRRPRRGGHQRRDRNVRCAARRRRRWPPPCAPCSTIRTPRSDVAIAARERLTSDFDWHTVADETAQVYLRRQAPRTRTAPARAPSSNARFPTG